MTTWTLLAFLGAALLIALTPGPGIFYVAARTLAGGRAEGIASSIGTGLGGMVHVAAGALGVSAIVMASADVFTAVKLVGAAYLVWLGIRTVREAGHVEAASASPSGTRRAFRDGVIVEAANPRRRPSSSPSSPSSSTPPAARSGSSSCCSAPSASR